MVNPRKVDPYVYVMEWIWRHSQATSSVRYVLLFIGRFMRWTPHGFETPPLPVKTIADGTDLVDSTVRRHLAALGALDGDLQIVKDRRRGETYRYRLRREPLLPLADLRPATHSRMAAVTPPILGADSQPKLSGDTADSERSERRNSAVTSPEFGGAVPEVSSFSEVRRTEAHHHDDDPRIAEFLAWFVANFPAHNNGGQTSLDDGDRELVSELLASRSVERLQAMAVVMWTVTLSEDDWLAKRTRRGIRLLRHAAEQLDRISRDRERGQVAAAVDADSKWAEACELLRSRPYYDTWIAPLRPHLEARGPGSVSRGLILFAPTRAFRQAMPADVEEHIRWACRLVQMRVEFAWSADRSSEEATA